MAWDDAAPTADDLKPTAGGWDSEPPTKEELEGPTVAGLGRNAVQDVSEAASGLKNLAGQFVEHPLDTATATVKAIPGGLMREGQRIGVGELLTGHPVAAAEKFGRAAYEKPVSTALDVLPFAPAAGKALGLGEDVAKGIEAGSEAGKAAETAETAVPAIEKAAAEVPGIEKQALPPPAANPAPSAKGVLSDLSNLTDIPIQQKAKEVKDYISRGYEGFAKKPGAIADVADYIQGKSQMAAAQQMGATPLQARQVGHEAMRAIGQYALDNDIVSPTTGLRGMRAQNTKLLNAAGEKIGALRKAADAARVPETDMVDVLQQVKAKLDPKYTRGSFSGEAGTYAKALEDIEDAEATHQGIADAATKLNDAANKANKINQPHNAYTDVANEISRINNERIKAALGPAKATEYEQALREYGVNKKISAMLTRKEAGEVKRMGPGSLTSNVTQKMLDEFGYKAFAKAANKVSTSVLKSPSIAKSLPSLFKEFINQVEDIGHEVTGLSEGGVVPKEMADFVGAR